jgi:hypothetical protein
MSQPIDSEKIISLFHTLLEETFEKVNGVYLDRGTSLLETLASLSAAEASKPIADSGTSIASQVDHIRFYLKMLNDYIDGVWPEKVDWQGSWSRKSVTDSEWNELRAELLIDYQNLLDHLNSITDWNDDRRLGGAMGIIVHTAYHLGAIRQIIRVVRG